MKSDKHFTKDYAHVDIIFSLSSPFLKSTPHKTSHDKNDENTKMRHIFNGNQAIQET